MSTQPVDKPVETDRTAIRAAISNAYYDTRNAGRTMEQAADDAADRVVAIVEEPRA